MHDCVGVVENPVGSWSWAVEHFDVQSGDGAQHIGNQGRSMHGRNDETNHRCSTTGHGLRRDTLRVHRR
jgi:hypothetical protein